MSLGPAEILVLLVVVLVFVGPRRLPEAAWHPVGAWQALRRELTAEGPA